MILFCSKGILGLPWKEESFQPFLLLMPPRPHHPPPPLHFWSPSSPLRHGAEQACRHLQLCCLLPLAVHPGSLPRSRYAVSWLPPSPSPATLFQAFSDDSELVCSPQRMRRSSATWPGASWDRNTGERSTRTGLPAAMATCSPPSISLTKECGFSLTWDISAAPIARPWPSSRTAVTTSWSELATPISLSHQFASL